MYCSSTARLSNTPINFSTIGLYFIEPKALTNIFSDNLGKFYNLTQVSNGVYECKTDDGLKNIYKYRNGNLYELELRQVLAVFLGLIN